MNNMPIFAGIFFPKLIMKINFAKLSPGGNDTILVRSPVEKQRRADIARIIMSDKYLQAEQVGYLSPSNDCDVRLDMMGGELCINAVRSAAALTKLDCPDKEKIMVSSSGSRSPIECTCSNKGEGKIFVSAKLNIQPVCEQLDDGTKLVCMDGISHLLVPCQKPLNKFERYEMYYELSEKYSEKLRDMPAFGVIPYYSDGDIFQIFPVVYVRDTDTVVAETGCGSGSIALAVSISNSNGSYTVLQPSGCSYQVCVTKEEKQMEVSLGGNVDLLVRGVAFINKPKFEESISNTLL